MLLHANLIKPGGDLPVTQSTSQVYTVEVKRMPLSMGSYGCIRVQTALHACLVRACGEQEWLPFHHLSRQLYISAKLLIREM